MCIWLDVRFPAVGASVIATDAWLKWSIVRGDDISGNSRSLVDIIML